MISILLTSFKGPRFLPRLSVNGLGYTPSNSCTLATRVSRNQSYPNSLRLHPNYLHENCHCLRVAGQEFPSVKDFLMRLSRCSKVQNTKYLLAVLEFRCNSYFRIIANFIVGKLRLGRDVILFGQYDTLKTTQSFRRCKDPGPQILRLILTLDNILAIKRFLRTPKKTGTLA